MFRISQSGPEKSRCGEFGQLLGIECLAGVLLSNVGLGIGNEILKGAFGGFLLCLFQVWKMHAPRGFLLC